MSFQEVRVDAQDMEQQQPRQAHEASDRGIEFNRDGGIARAVARLVALETDAAEKKRVGGEVVGAADALVFPDLLSANLTVKAIMYTADCRFGGVLLGTTAPVAFMSRADSVATRLQWMAGLEHLDKHLRPQGPAPMAHEPEPEPEVDARFITLATLHELFIDGKIDRKLIDQAIKDLGIDPEKLNPVIS